jgi:hypothetical protein
MECQQSFLVFRMYYLLNFGDSVFLRGALSTPKIGLMAIAINSIVEVIGMPLCSIIGNVDLGGDMLV